MAKWDPPARTSDPPWRRRRAVGTDSATGVGDQGAHAPRASSKPGPKPPSGPPPAHLVPGDAGTQQGSPPWHGPWYEVFYRCWRGDAYTCLACNRAFGKSHEDPFPLWQHLAGGPSGEGHPTKADTDRWNEEWIAGGLNFEPLNKLIQAGERTWKRRILRRGVHRRTGRRAPRTKA